MRSASPIALSKRVGSGALPAVGVYDAATVDALDASFQEHAIPTDLEMQVIADPARLAVRETADHSNRLAAPDRPQGFIAIDPAVDAAGARVRRGAVCESAAIEQYTARMQVPGGPAAAMVDVEGMQRAPGISRAAVDRIARRDIRVPVRGRNDDCPRAIPIVVARVAAVVEYRGAVGARAHISAIYQKSCSRGRARLAMEVAVRGSDTPRSASELAGVGQHTGTVRIIEFRGRMVQDRSDRGRIRIPTPYGEGQRRCLGSVGCHGDTGQEPQRPSDGGRPAHRSFSGAGRIVILVRDPTRATILEAVGRPLGDIAPEAQIDDVQAQVH